MQRIRDQILAVEPVNDMDTKVFSDYLADQSKLSKSDDEIREDNEKAKAAREKELAAEREKERLK